LIEFAGPLFSAEFLRRDNRFRATVLLEGAEVSARIANPGRLTELCVPGHTCYVAPAAGPERKTRFDLCLIAYAGTLVSLDTRLPNALFEDALRRGCLSLPGYTADLRWRREVRLGESRIDFLLLPAGERPCWVETKSVSLIENGRALFPDAPTARGRRHLAELTAARAAGDQAMLVFIVQRDDALVVTPHPTADPAFSEALRRARAAGVQLLAYTCHVSLAGIEILREIEVQT
jgi:sugar fermentation stimulation protein A